MLGFNPFLFFRVLRHRAKIQSLRFVSGSPASHPDSIPSFCFGFSSITLGFDPFLLFQVLWYHAQIRSFPFVLGSPISHSDLIPSFCFGFSGIMPEFDPFFLFRVLRHRASIPSLLFILGSPTSFSDSIPFYAGFSGIVLRFDFILFYFFISSSPASCPDFHHLPRHYDKASRSSFSYLFQHHFWITHLPRHRGRVSLSPSVLVTQFR